MRGETPCSNGQTSISCALFASSTSIEHISLRCAVSSLKPLQNGRGRDSARAQEATLVPVALAKEREREREREKQTERETESDKEREQASKREGGPGVL